MRIGLILILAAVLLGACNSDGAPSDASLIGNARPVTARNLQTVNGQRLYVPAYSEIFLGSPNRTIELSVTLSIHNTDLDQPIVVESVRYYNTDGEFVRDYVEESIEIAPLATIGFIVPDDELAGGWGANFIVEWGSSESVYEPIVEAVMVSTQGTFGISMISPGRILSQTLPAAAEPVEP